MDSGISQGDVVTAGFDPMLTKLVVHGANRAEALAHAEQALRETVLLGCTSNIGFLRRLIGLPQVKAGELHTGLIAEEAEALRCTCTGARGDAGGGGGGGAFIQGNSGCCGCGAGAAWSYGRVAELKGSKVFFSEEKKQKTFANSGVCAACEGRDSIRKSFLVLFFKKEHFLSLCNRASTTGENMYCASTRTR